MRPPCASPRSSREIRSPRAPAFLLAAAVTPLLALLTAACAAQPPAGPQPPLQTLGQFRGQWLKNAHAEVFIAIQPTVRVLAFRPVGGQSLMADDPALGEVGVRIAFMEPTQIPESFGPGNQPATFTASTPTSATVLAAVDQPSGLQLELTAALDPAAPPDAPALRLTYTLHNRSGRPRRIAVWSVTALPRQGAVVAPFGDRPRALRRLVYSWWTTLPQPGLNFGRDTLLVDFDQPLAGSAFKVGVTTEAGWVAAIRPDGRALLSRVAYREGETYPEGGANLTIFQFVGEDRRWCEFEQVGPLTQVAEGEAATLSETLTLLRLTPPQAGDADAWRAAIEAAER